MVTTLDDILDFVHQTSPELRGGGANHAPMVAEALCTLGRPDAMQPWFAAHQRRCQAPPAPHAAITSATWPETLGQRERLGDWIAWFDHALAEAPWPFVLQTWVPRLAPGLMAAAAHGLIRTGHAVRSLAAQVTSPRLHELAQGLGYWAARYQPLPGSPAHDAPGLPLPEAMAQVPRFHGPGFVASGAIVQQLQGLADEPAFPPVINLLDTSGDLSALLSALTATCASIYLANPQGLIAFVHAVTAPSALRLLLPSLPEAAARLAVRYVWQGCAGIYAWYATVPLPALATLTPPPVSRAALIDHAVAAGGAHTIKFVEVCLREDALAPNPVYWCAAHDAPTRVGTA